jgi:mannose-6-phosphate isomerase-like protein (cupin superfamily)
MPENGDKRAAAIDRYWDAITRGERPADHIDRSLAETIVQMHERDDAPEPDLAFVARLERDLAAATFPLSSDGHATLHGAAASPYRAVPKHLLSPAASPRTIPLSRSVLAPLASAALLVLTLVASFVAIGGRTKHFTLPAVPAPASWSNTLVLRAGLSAMSVGEVGVGIDRWTFSTRAEAWQSTAPSRPELLYVEAGSLVASVDGKATLARATSVKRGAVSVPVGTDIPLRSGDLLVVPAGARFTLRGDGEITPTLLVVAFHGLQGDEKPVAVAPNGITVQRLGSGTLTGLPGNSSIVILRRLDVGPRAALPEEITAGPELLVVEAGSVRVRAVPDGSEVMRAADGETSAVVPGGSRLSIHNASDEPLALLRLMVIPTN